MARSFSILIFVLTTVYTHAQIEIPAGDFECNIAKSNELSYCTCPKSEKINWTAMQIKGDRLGDANYLSPDSDYFKTMPNSISEIWNKAEQQTRTWAIEFDSIYVVTGVVMLKNQQEGYYKAILKGCQGDGLGFYITESTSNSDLKQVAMSINQIEELTGLDFFPSLNKDLQEIFEAEFDWEFWPITQ